MRALSLLLAWIGCLALTTTAFAGTMDYQGYFEEGGNPIGGEHAVRLSLWNAPSEGEELWGEPDTTLAFDRGLFTVKLGLRSPLTLAVFQHPDVYLEVRLDGGVFATRTKLSSVPYAFLAELATEATHAATADSANVAAYAHSAGSGDGGDSLWAAEGDDIHNTNVGNVGIGTELPLGILNVRSLTGDHNRNSIWYDAVNPALKLNSLAAGNHQSSVQFLKSGVFRWSLLNDIHGNDEQTFGLRDWISGTYPWAVDGSGNVGIGTESPLHTLHVNGGSYSQMTLTGASAAGIHMHEGGLDPDSPRMVLAGHSSGMGIQLWSNSSTWQATHLIPRYSR